MNTLRWAREPKPTNPDMEGITLYTAVPMKDNLAIDIELAIDNHIKSVKKKYMKSRNLTLAVLTTIGSFHASQQNFSAHDITKSVRAQVAQDLLDVTDVPRDFDDGGTGSLRPRIAHDQVRQIVRDIFEDGLVPDYKPHTTYRGGATFVEYRFPESDSNTTLTPALPAPVVAPAQPVAVASVTPPTELEKAIEVYVVRKLAAGQYPTLKQIQSRLKRTPATCDEIRGIIKKLGYKTIPNITAPSAPSYDAVTA